MNIELKHEETNNAILELLIKIAAQQDALLKLLRTDFAVANDEAVLQAVHQELDATKIQMPGYDTVQLYTIGVLVETFGSLSACSNLVSIALSKSDEHLQRIEGYINETRRQSINSILEDLYARHGKLDINQILNSEPGSNP